MAEAYKTVGGSLNLKGLKKKKSKSKRQTLETDKGQQAAKEQLAEAVLEEKMTPTERAFRKMQRERELERIRTKASKSHKEKVQELNKYLDKLSEHYDIPKVSWTK